VHKSDHAVWNGHCDTCANKCAVPWR
jgi:hypothetical protein